eukprot:COSAG02_NODE_40081_length_409_cov_1.035484_1_plen_85_part_01
MARKLQFHCGWAKGAFCPPTMLGVSCISQYTPLAMASVIISNDEVQNQPIEWYNNNGHERPVPSKFLRYCTLFCYLPIYQMSGQS